MLFLKHAVNSIIDASFGVREYLWKTLAGTDFFCFQCRPAGGRKSLIFIIGLGPAPAFSRMRGRVFSPRSAPHFWPPRGSVSALFLSQDRYRFCHQIRAEKNSSSADSRPCGRAATSRFPHGTGCHAAGCVWAPHSLGPGAHVALKWQNCDNSTFVGSQIAGKMRVTPSAARCRRVSCKGEILFVRRSCSRNGEQQTHAPHAPKPRRS